MFYSPRASKTSWSYGTAGATLTATASKTLTWKVAVTSPCAATTVRTLTGTGTASGGISAVWDGKSADGTWARPGTYDLTLTATNGSGTLNNAPPWTVRVTVLPTATSPEGLCPERIGGSNRYAVSVAVSRLANPTATTIVVANGTEAAMGDALVSGPLARSKKAALLLTYATTLPPEVSAEITRRKATTAFLVGGTGSISTNVVTQLRALGITAVTRYDGVDRFEVAANVARAVAPTSPDVMVASGRPAAIADGLVLSGPAAGLVRPIVLVTDSYVPAPTALVLKTVGAQRTVVAGGTATVPDAVMNQLPSPTRLGGQSRYEVSASVASWARGKIPVSSVLVSAGVQTALADTLSGGQLGRPTLYVNSLVVPAPVASWLDTSPDLSKVTVLGGSASVPDRVAGLAQQAALQ
jgi:putative cell wall-binding protein